MDREQKEDQNNSSRSDLLEANVADARTRRQGLQGRAMRDGAERGCAHEGVAARRNPVFVSFTAALPRRAVLVFRDPLD
jgi:hypothetical protein